MIRRTRRSSWLFVTLLVPAIVQAQRSASSSNLSDQQILEAIGAHEGSTVCEVGAGDGALTIAAARLVGPAGHVYANELGERRVSALKDAVTKSGLGNIAVFEGDAGRTNFPDAGCDAVFLRDVYHHLTDPAAMNASMFAALKPGGRLAVVDFTPPGQEASRPDERGKDGSHGVTAATVTRELKEAGFEPLPGEAPPQRWFMVLVEKPRAP